MSAVLEDPIAVQPLAPLVEPLSPVPVYRWSIAQYHRLVADGYLVDGHFELLTGWIVRKMTQGPLHCYVVTQLTQLLFPLLGGEWKLRVQQALTTDSSEPEPDLAVVRNLGAEYSRRHPVGREVGLLIEVSDSSRVVDRMKEAIYARAGVSVYWIVDVNHGTIEVHTQPDPKGGRYQEVRVYHRGELVPIDLHQPSVQLNLNDILPPVA